jgi:peptidoglycan/LPS O-acetylase OafA/YrhL
MTGNPASSSGPASGGRFTVVDALRGVAAFTVLLHHLLFSSDLQKTLWLAFPVWFCEFCHDGAFGVQIFFVISGFVITHSLRNVRLSPRAVGNFMLRRQLRLDPPYWTVILLTVILLSIEMRFPWIERKPLPTVLDFVKNLFYLQNVTGAFQIVSVAWTLCLEVQFYLVFILLLLAGKYLSAFGGKALTYSALLVGLLGVVSMLLPNDHSNHWFIQWWYYFAAGALCYWSIYNPRFRALFIGFLIFFFVVAALEDPTAMLTGWSTAVLLYTAGRLGKLGSWLDFAPLQYLGRISYSLYLTHILIAVYVLRLGYRLTGANHAAALVWFVLAGIVAILFAHLLYLVVERRSIRFAARFRTPREPHPSLIPEQPAPSLPAPIEDLQNA